MKTRIQKLLVGAALVGAATLVQAQFTYTNNGNGTCTITGYTGPGGAVTIPNSIAGLSVVSIGSDAFDGKTSLTSVTIPPSVTNIGFGAFYYCTSLTNVTIPASVTGIGDGAFSYCTSLTAITVDAANSFYTSASGVLFDKNQTTLIAFPAGQGGSYAIPGSVTSIGGRAFEGCTSLAGITIPGSVIGIEDYAFAGCTSLTSVTIPDSVTNIEDGAFDACYNLTSVTIGEGVASIGLGAFVYCTSLISITIPDSVTSIGAVAFWLCTSLTNVAIGKGLTSIGDQVFDSCTSLRAITVDASNAFYSSANGVLFDKKQTTLIAFPGGRGGSYSIPASVSSIKDIAFLGCNLTSVTIPDSVTSIGDYAFQGCPRLASVTIGNGVTSIGFEAFLGCDSLTAAYFLGNAPPDSGDMFDDGLGYDPVIVYYLPGTTGWGATFADRPTALWALPYPLILNNDSRFGVQTNGFSFIISWANATTVVVEASTNLANASWVALQSLNLTNGAFYFSDSESMNYPTRFYRIRSP